MKFTTERVESRPVLSIITTKEVITDVNTQGSENRVKIRSIFGEYNSRRCSFVKINLWSKFDLFMSIMCMTCILW